MLLASFVANAARSPQRPGDDVTGWHSDIPLSPWDGNDFVTFWIPLSDLPKSSPALLYASRSHADFALNFWGGQEDLEGRYVVRDHLPLSVGDVVAHHGFTLHSSKPSGAGRTAYAVSYVSAGARVRRGFKKEKGKREDEASYGGWVKDVGRRGKLRDDHPVVPVVWPTPNRFIK